MLRNKCIVYSSIIVLLFLQIRNLKSQGTYAADVSKQTELNLVSILGRRRCPGCDHSVFSYCSEKLFHDSCCCNNPNNPYYPLPEQCILADCSFLHANSCQDHKLITACCCIKTHNLYHKK